MGLGTAGATVTLSGRLHQSQGDHKWSPHLWRGWAKTNPAHSEVSMSRDKNDITIRPPGDGTAGSKPEQTVRRLVWCINSVCELSLAPASWNTPSRVRVDTPQPGSLLQCRVCSSTQNSAWQCGSSQNKGNTCREGSLEVKLLQWKPIWLLPPPEVPPLARDPWDMTRERERERESLRSDAMLLTITGSVQLGPELWSQRQNQIVQNWPVKQVYQRFSDVKVGMCLDAVSLPRNSSARFPDCWGGVEMQTTQITWVLHPGK